MGELGIGFKDSEHAPELAGGDLREPGQRPRMSAAMNVPVFNRHGVWAIYRFEMARFVRTLLQSLVTPVITTSLYFVVFGSAIGSRMSRGGRRVLRRVHRAGADHAVAVHREHLQRLVRHLLPEVHRHDLRAAVGADLLRRDGDRLRRRGRDQVDRARPDHPGTATFFVPVQILHPLWMIAFLLLTATTFSLFGFVIGIWAKGFEQLQFIPMLIVTPLTFLGGAFYSIDMLPPAWRTVALFNPVVYLISGFRWSFYGTADVGVGVSLAMGLMFCAAVSLTKSKAKT